MATEKLPPAPPAISRARSISQREGDTAVSRKVNASPQIDTSRTGRRPKRSLSAPKIGADTNCSEHCAVPISLCIAIGSKGRYQPWKYRNDNRDTHHVEKDGYQHEWDSSLTILLHCYFHRINCSFHRHNFLFKN